MRAVSLPALSPNASADQKLDWCVRAIQEISRASREEAIAVFDSFAITGATPTVTRTLNVTSPTTSNIVAVLATLFDDLQRRGVKKTG